MGKVGLRRLLVIAAVCVTSAVATAWGADSRLDVVDYIVKGDAQSALKGFAFPFKHNDLYPLVREIKTHDEFVRLFPIMFDAETRKLLQSKQGKTGGWDFKNWQGEMFGDGELWRESLDWKDSRRLIFTVNVTSESLKKYYRELYEKDLATLAPRYRLNVCWVKEYFKAEDNSIFGRIDAWGKDEREEYGKRAKQYRIMIFKQGQKTSDRPTEIYYCKEKDGSLASDDGKIEFSDCSYGPEDAPAMLLTYKNGRDDKSVRLAYADWNVLAGANRDSGGVVALSGYQSVAEPKDIELLDESGDIALFAGKTAEDKAYDAKMLKDGDGLFTRRSLFMRRRMKSGTNEWSVVMTAEGDWKIAEGMDEWCAARAKEARSEFDVVKTRLSKDGKSIWMVCNPHTSVYSIVCRFDLESKIFRVLMDGDTAEEQPDGTILVKGKKTYLSDANGEPLGAAWYDAWITPEGKVVRKSKPVTMAEMQERDNK